MPMGIQRHYLILFLSKEINRLEKAVNIQQQKNLKTFLFSIIFIRKLFYSIFNGYKCKNEIA